ncbi:terminase small subunit [Hymenobacter sp. YC55]|uniref:terminase small subunit n=1 Tax=Hymenobacter sp. YC55 TaxID=3034019 RepID=UPI0023F8A8CF|nr:terminase small subunit [Hymenobacter sp. YC55]MDF7810770.1 terminase small subunit [Hymenobacter sp. YC55]
MKKEKEKDAAQLALEKLPPQQRKFVEAYCLSFNATKAALEAKYSAKTARTQGSRLLTIVDIQKAVKAVLATSAMEPEEIAARWTALARAGLSDFYTKVEYEERSTIQQPLEEAIAQMWQEYEFDKEYTYRSAELLGLKDEALSEYVKDLVKQETRLKLDELRYRMRLERDPKAFRFIDGPKVKKERMELDLVKAEQLGMLDLIKSIVPGEFGLKVELRSPDAAMDNLAKWRGMLTSKVDITTGGAALGGPDLSNLSDEELGQYETLLRKATPPKS